MDVIAGALDEIGVEGVDVLGYSFGGVVAQDFADRRRRSAGRDGWRRRRFGTR